MTRLRLLPILLICLLAPFAKAQVQEEGERVYISSTLKGDDA